MPKNGLAKHIALVGMTGVGKSTLVNVLNGSDRAPVSNSVDACTTRAEKYSIKRDGIEYCLWDTRGLNEAQEQGAKGPLSRLLKLLRGSSDADRELRAFLRRKDVKFDLILFCIDAEKIRVAAQWKHYDRIFAKFCKQKTTVAVIVTRMDPRTYHSDWRGTCHNMVKDVAGVSPDARLVEAVMTFNDFKETTECGVRVWRLIRECS